MSMFTDLVKSSLGGAAGAVQDQTPNLLQGVLDLFDQAGGVEGIKEKFQQSGLGEVFSSWIGTGRNKPITAEQLASVLGQDQIDALTQHANIPQEKGASVLAQVLPALVDKLSPDGRVPDKSQLMTLGKFILGGLGVAAAAGAAASMLGKKEEEEPAAAAPTASDSSDVTADPSAVAHGSSGDSTSASYTVVAGDTLSKIAKELFGDANQWQRIFEANRDQLDNPDRILPGQVLRIP